MHLRFGDFSSLFPESARKRVPERNSTNPEDQGRKDVSISTLSEMLWLAGLVLFRGNDERETPECQTGWPYSQQLTIFNGDWMSASLSANQRVMLTSGQTDNGKALNAHGARSIRWIRAASIGGSTPLLQSMTEHTKHYSSTAFVPYTDRVSIV